MSRLPESIGKYKITERLERGGMSLLYKAEHPTLGRPVVLKKLMLKGGAEHRNRFRREASLMMELRHENVVGVFDHFQEGSGRYLVMEYVEGSSLAELLSREGALTPAEVQWLTGRIALALSHIHSRGVVHRDVKPSNVLLGKDGSVKLGDFGIAFEPGETEELTSSGTTLGTPGFMAPEQLEDARSADERSDIWSLGVCCFELITGRKFITGPTPAAIRKALPGAVRGYRQRLPERLPRSLQRFLRKTLVMNAASRLPDGQAAADLLKAVPGTPPPEELMLRLEKLMGGPVAKRPVKAAQPAAGHTKKKGPVKGAEAASKRSSKEKAPAFPDSKSAPESRTVRPEKSSAGPKKRPQKFFGRSQGPRRKEQPGGPELSQKGADRRVSQRSAARRVSQKGADRRVPQKGADRRVSSRWNKSLKQMPSSLRLFLPLLLCAALLLLVPGLWERCFRRGSSGMLRLELSYPPEASRYWLESAKVSIYRETENKLSPVVQPVLHSSEGVLLSRKLFLPAGAYRLEWSLGDSVSWNSFHLPPFSEQKERGSFPLVLTEHLENPPVFPLEVEWTVRNALSGELLEGPVSVSWERLDQAAGAPQSGTQYSGALQSGGKGASGALQSGTQYSGALQSGGEGASGAPQSGAQYSGALQSGGRYRFAFSSSGYRSAFFTVAVSPWRRHLRLQASLWPEPARLEISNTSDRNAFPRVDGAGKYLDLSAAPALRRPGRLPAGESTVLLVTPGIHVIAPGLGKRGGLEVNAAGGETLRLVVTALNSTGKSEKNSENVLIIQKAEK